MQFEHIIINAQRFRHIWLAAIVLCLSGFLQLAAAQSPQSTNLQPPNFTTGSLTQQKEQLANNPNLTPEQISVASESYDAARTALEAASKYIETAAQIRRDTNNAPATLEALAEEIKAAQNFQPSTRSNDPASMTDENLLKLQRELIVKEGQLSALRTDVQNYDESLQALLQRPLRETLSSVRQQLSSITADIEAFGDASDIDPVTRARAISLRARAYNRRAQIQALELEISSMAESQLILRLRRDLATLKATQAEGEVATLQEQTGIKRLTEAKRIGQETMDMLSLLEGAHPFLVDYAAENVSISYKLKDIAANAGAIPKKKATARTQSDAIKNDLDIARQLTELGEINRQSSATLRRLRNQRPSGKAVRTGISETQKIILAASQDRLWAQEKLRGLPLGQFDVKNITKEWVELNGSIFLSSSDTHILQVLYIERRKLLNVVSTVAISTNNEGSDLRTLQQELLKNTSDIRTLLDQKLLWLPSVTAINSKWPERVLRGTFKTFNLSNFSLAGRVLLVEAQRHIFWVLICVSLALALLLLRRSMRVNIKQTAQFVGRVQKDSYWHTPRVIAENAAIAAPIPLLILLVGILFQFSPSPDPFIQSLSQTGIELSGFLFFFLTWREWNRDDSLLGPHYKLAKPIRRSVFRHLNWFIPAAGVSIALVTVTQNSREPDIYEGFSLLAFMITSLLLSIFAARVLWAKRDAFKSSLAETSLLWRYRQLILIIAIGLPVLSGVLAAAGYYDTARELLSRLFFSGGLLIGTYVTYGLIRRTVVIAQRRIALRQAIERRELSLKARAEKEAAEERGDPPPPPVNYDEIDLESISRQSAQLLSTFMVIGFALLMWLFWQDLLPALSIFDNVQLWGHLVTDTDGSTTKEWVTLWSLMQALVIVVITFIAAKNLPGFLEVFILSRSGFDAGTRYAIVSVLGYIIVAIGIVIAFNKLGTEWSQLQWIIAALGVGIGFGLQEIIANFISGLIILFERPVRIGDYVTIGDQSGSITRIKIRATTLSDLDNKEILIPNKELITGRVTNWTLSNSTTRMIIRVGIAYGSDTDKAREIMLDKVRNNPKILDNPTAQAFFLGFGDSSLDFEIRFFLRSFEDRFPVSHVVHTEINKALEEAGISIPFPQRDLHIISQPPQKPT